MADLRYQQGLEAHRRCLELLSNCMALPRKRTSELIEIVGESFDIAVLSEHRINANSNQWCNVVVYLGTCKTSQRDAATAASKPPHH